MLKYGAYGFISSSVPTAMALVNRSTTLRMSLYGSIYMLSKAMAVGTDDEINPYAPYLSIIGEKSPAYFETYTFNHHPMSLVRFLDEKKFEGGATQYEAKPKKDNNPFAAVSIFGMIA